MQCAVFLTPRLDLCCAVGITNVPVDNCDGTDPRESRARCAMRCVRVVVLCLLPLKVGGLLSDRLGLSAICAGNYARVASVTWRW